MLTFQQVHDRQAESKQRPWSALPLWARRPRKPISQGLKPELLSIEPHLDIAAGNPTTNDQCGTEADNTSLDWIDSTSWDMPGWVDMDLILPNLNSSMHSSRDQCDNGKSWFPSPSDTSPEPSEVGFQIGEHGFEDSVELAQSEDDVENIGMTVSVMNDDANPLAGNRTVWRCSWPGCPSRMLFIRACDLRKHHRRHSQRLYCRHPGCPRSAEGDAPALNSPRTQSTASFKGKSGAPALSISDSSSSAIQGNTWFASERDRARHEAKHNPRIRCSWEGGICGRVFSRLDNMKDHVQRVHGGISKSSAPKAKCKTRHRHTAGAIVLSSRRSGKQLW